MSIKKLNISASCGTPLVAALALGICLPAHADDKSDLAALKELLAQQQQQIERLEKRVATQESAITANPELASGTSAKSKPSLEVYGVFDTGVEHISNVSPNNKSVTRVPSVTGTMASRLGVNASHELGGGYRAIATLEAGFNPDDGTHGQGGRIFGRQAFGGVATPYGAFTVGRQYSMLIPSMMGSDLLGPNIYAPGSLDVYLPNARFDNAIAWKGNFDKLTLGMNYSFGRDTQGGQPLTAGPCSGEVAGDNKNCKAWSAMAKYDADRYGANLAVDEQHGGGSTTTTQFWNGAAPISFTHSSDTDRRLNAGAYVKFGAFKIAGGWLGRKVSTTAVTVKSDLYYLGSSYQITSHYLIDGGISHISNKDQDRSATVYTIRGFYNVDENLSAYVQFGHIANSSKSASTLSVGSGVSPNAGQDQDGYMIGARYRF